MQIKDYKAPENCLAGHIILITGAGDGIGKTLALNCASQGATVVLLGRTIKKLESVYDEIETNGGPQPAIYPMNLEGATINDYDELASKLESEFGKLDGLVHNAGLLGELTTIQQTDFETWMRVMQVNLNGPFLMTQSLLPLLKKANAATIIFTSSSVGRKGRAHWGAYAVSKFATEGLSQILADELQTNTTIRVNAINPGKTRTHMRAEAYPAEDPLTLPSPQSIMPAYLYLLCSESQGITGQSFDAQ